MGSHMEKGDINGLMEVYLRVNLNQACVMASEFGSIATALCMRDASKTTLSVEKENRLIKQEKCLKDCLKMGKNMKELYMTRTRIQSKSPMKCDILSLCFKIHLFNAYYKIQSSFISMADLFLASLLKNALYLFQQRICFQLFFNFLSRLLFYMI